MMEHVRAAAIRAGAPSDLPLVDSWRPGVLGFGESIELPIPTIVPMAHTSGPAVLTRSVDVVLDGIVYRVGWDPGFGFGEVGYVRMTSGSEIAIDARPQADSS